MLAPKRGAGEKSLLTAPAASNIDKVVYFSCSHAPAQAGPEEESRAPEEEKKATKPVMGQSPAVGALIDYRESSKKSVRQMASVDEDDEADEEAVESTGSGQVHYTS